MLDNQIGGQQHQDGPEDRLHGILREADEIVLEELRIATIQLSYRRGPDILQTPSRYHRIITCDQEARKHTHISNKRQGIHTTHLPVGSRSVCLSMTADDKLTDHTGNTQQQHTDDIDDDENGTSILTSHIRETPYVTQSHSGTSSRQNDAKFASETCSFQFCHMHFSHNFAANITKI